MPSGEREPRHQAAERCHGHRDVADPARPYARLRHRLPGVALRPHVVECGLEVRQLLLGQGQLLPQLGVGPRSSAALRQGRSDRTRRSGDAGATVSIS